MSKKNKQGRNQTLSSASKGRWRRISRGSTSVAITTISAIPRLSAFVAEQKKNRENYTKISFCFTNLKVQI